MSCLSLGAKSAVPSAVAAAAAASEALTYCCVQYRDVLLPGATCVDDSARAFKMFKEGGSPAAASANADSSSNGKMDAWTNKGRNKSHRAGR